MDPDLRRDDWREGRRWPPTSILVIDEGTTSTRAMLFGADGACLGAEQSELTQHYPRPGWVEHDAEEIWRPRASPARAAMVERAGGAERIAAIGITNQRETIVFWSAADRRAARAGDRLAGPAHRRRSARG